MSRKEKLVKKLLSTKQGFKWAELVTLLKLLGYEEIQGDGSRVKFDNGNPDHLINLHKPHPRPELKAYAIKQVIEKLIRAGLI